MEQKKKHPLLKMSVTMMRNYPCMTHSDDKLQEVQNDHATCTSGFASKDDIQDDHRLYDQSSTKKCMTVYITVNSSWVCA